MRLNKLTTLNQRKGTVFMDERVEQQNDKEKAIIAIVHEIRNPLTSIKLSNQMMQAAFEKEEQKELLMQSYMTIISKNIEKIEQYLKEVLDYKNRGPVLVPVNICDCIDRAICETSDRVYLSEIELNHNYSSSPWVLGDIEKLVTAFVNIIINAIEAIKTGNGKIWISVYETKNTVRITFKDNGEGMDSHFASRLFDSHFQANGHGIGLNTVKEIIDLHKAQIVADSLPGIGTSISILFNSIPEDDIPTMLKRVSGPVSDDHNR